MAHRLLCGAPAMALRALVRPRCVQAVRPAPRVHERAGARSTLRRWCSLSLHNVPAAPRIGALPTCGEERVRCFSTVSGAPPSEQQDVSVGVMVEGRPLGRDRCNAAHVLQAMLAWCTSGSSGGAVGHSGGLLRRAKARALAGQLQEDAVLAVRAALSLDVPSAEGALCVRRAPLSMWCP